MDQNLVLAAAAAVEAGDAIMKVYASDFEVGYKEDESPLTRADENSHRVIVSRLAVTGIPVLSEEGKSIPYSERKNWKELFVVDPLDGTKEFIKRNGEFTVNIALVRNGEPVMGVIYVPVTQLLYFASRETGGFLLAVDNPAVPPDLAKAVRLPARDFPSTVTIVGSRSHASPETDAYIREMQEKHGAIDFAASGSSLKFCLLAEGKAHYYPRFAPTMEWDTAAGQAILEATGGKVTVHPAGEPLRYNREELRNPWFLATAKGC